ncbi:ABC transporter substrate-binding protein [Geochorda subterranea]|uniref:ABC transporter substrate-binding protein n=1 Tax=Geochorda subterranea TaxID=3109564 RepID=A0ABZ1BPD5_9FIRM|nr:ABC transporter substrate-binding protein [Limnochorda sp. LNt]WRP14421.1 ABC transporter substrate-binding protein [Limnochorda sp. LNt]
MRRSFVALLGAVVLVAVTGASLALAGTLPRNETLYIAGHQWGPPTNFNPLAPSPAWPVNGTGSTAPGGGGYIYESLFLYDIVNGRFDPLLAQGFQWVDAATMRIQLQPGTRWQDGRPLTARDVVFTFELARRFSLGYSPFWQHVQSVRAVDDRTVEIRLDPARPNRLLVEEYVATVFILPEHIWGPLADRGRSALIEFENLDPVGSGPYRVDSYNPERIILRRYDEYWGRSIYGMPTPRYLVHPIFRSNDAGNLALRQAEVDLSQQFVPQIWTLPNVKTWFAQEPYHIPGSIPLLIINVHRKGLDNVAVRRALAYAIDYALIARTAMSRYSEPARSSLIIPAGVEARFFNEELVNRYGWRYYPARSVEILERELGARKGSDGIYVLPDGTRLSFTVQTPYGWTDWMAALEIVSQSARQVGIEVRTEFPQAPVVTSNVQEGNFDMALWYVSGVGPASPWTRFRDVLDDRAAAPIGQQTFQNYGRFSHPDVARLLDQAAQAGSVEELRRIYGELDRIFMENVPAIPLMYRPLAFYEFNETHWTGFPTASDPKAPPAFYISVLRLVRPR